MKVENKTPGTVDAHDLDPGQLEPTDRTTALEVATLAVDEGTDTPKQTSVFSSSKKKVASTTAKRKTRNSLRSSADQSTDDNVNTKKQRVMGTRLETETTNQLKDNSSRSRKPSSAQSKTSSSCASKDGTDGLQGAESHDKEASPTNPTDSEDVITQEVAASHQHPPNPVPTTLTLAQAKCKFYPSSLLDLTEASNLLRAVVDFYEQYKGRRSDIVDVGTYVSNEKKVKNDHKFDKFKLALPSAVQVAKKIWRLDPLSTLIDVSTVETQARKNVSLEKLLNMKVLGDGENAKSMVVPCPDHKLDYLDTIRMKTLEEMRCTGVFKEVIQRFNRRNGYFAGFGWDSSKTLPEEAVKEGLDDFSFALGACEIHVGTPDAHRSFEFFRPHRDKIGDLVKFFCLQGSSWNILVVNDGFRPIRTGKDAYKYLEDGKKYCGCFKEANGDEDQAVAFKKWCEEMSHDSTKCTQDFKGSLDWFFRELINNNSFHADAPVRVLIFHIAQFDRLAIPAGTSCHGTIVRAEKDDVAATGWTMTPRILAIFHQLDRT